MIRMTLYSILLLTLAVGAVVALEPAGDGVMADQPEVAAASLERTGMMAVEAPLMSVEPQQTKAADLPQDLGATFGICWTSCKRCSSDSQCPVGERCRFGVQCP